MPTIALNAVTTTTKETVFQISVAVRLRNKSWLQLGPSDLHRLHDQERQGQEHGDRHEDGSDGEEGGKR